MRLSSIRITSLAVTALVLTLSYNQCSAPLDVPESEFSSTEETTAVALTSSSFSLVVNDSAQLTVVGGKGPYSVSVDPVTAGSVDQSFVFTALQEGAAVITARDVNNMMSQISINISAPGVISFSQSVQFAPGEAQWVVPTGVTVLRVKAWGGAGGSGSASTTNHSAGGGGAGGFAQSEITVTPGEVLTVRVGTGGAGASGVYNTDRGRGGAGGGYSGVFRTSTPLLIAGAGGGGGGGGSSSGGANGGAGGGPAGKNGEYKSSCTNAYGRGGTLVAGGEDGQCNDNGSGQWGGSLKGGNAEGGVQSGSALPGSPGGGYGGHRMGGGGGAGFFGGGGASQANKGGGGGGGGGSNYITGINKVDSQGVGINPPNASDIDYISGVGAATAGAITNNGVAGGNGRVVIRY